MGSKSSLECIRKLTRLTTVKQNRNFSSETKFSASKSSGPGGQNVNKVNTKVELRFNVRHSILLSDEEKILVLKKLANKINKDGELIVVAQSERSQIGNKEKAIEKLNTIIEQALHKDKKRIATKTPRSVIRKRLKNKKLNSEKKDSRKSPEIN